jgi:hypothetical protein
MAVLSNVRLGTDHLFRVVGERYKVYYTISGEGFDKYLRVRLYINGKERDVHSPKYPGDSYFEQVVDIEGPISIYLETDGGQSNTLRFEGVRGIDVPDGSIGIAAVVLPESERVITYDSRIPARDQPLRYFHPKVYVVSKCRENRWVTMEFWYFDKNGARIREQNIFKGFVRSTNVPDHPNTLLFHARDRVIIDFSQPPFNQYEHYFKVPSNVYPYTGICQIGAVADIDMEYFGTEQESDIHRFPATAPFEMRDIAPPAKKFKVDATLVPDAENKGAYNIVLSFTNNSTQKVNLNAYMNHMLTVNGEVSHSKYYADWATMHATLDPGGILSNVIHRPTPLFKPEPGRTYDICFLDNGETASVTQPDGSQETVQVVTYEYR